MHELKNKAFESVFQPEIKKEDEYEYEYYDETD